MRKLYTFKWGRELVMNIVVASLCVLFPFAFFCIIENHSPAALFLILVGALISVLFVVCVKLSSCIRHLEVDRGKIFIEHYLGGELVLSDIVSIKPVSKEEFDEHTTYEDESREKYGLETTLCGLDMKATSYKSSVYGEFTRVSNNLDELAMVTLRSGKKYLINYPRELLERKASVLSHRNV